jgi:hypothetical protein
VRGRLTSPDSVELVAAVATEVGQHGRGALSQRYKETGCPGLAGIAGNDRRRHRRLFVTGPAPAAVSKPTIGDGRHTPFGMLCHELENWMTVVNDCGVALAAAVEPMHYRRQLGECAFE